MRSLLHNITSRLFLALQYLLPKHLLTALVYRIARVRRTSVKNALIGWFVRAFDVDVEEAAGTVPDDYEHFNAFFTRTLQPGARPIDASADSVVSPVDGTISALGTIDAQQIYQAKGLEYDLAELLATDLDDTHVYSGGTFATLYLAPYNYHRVHCPAAATLRAARYVPGDLFSVNAATVSLLPFLFARNERLILHLQAAGFPFVLIFIGALNVGSISTPWTGEIRPRKRGVVEDIALRLDDTHRRVDKGALLGWFNMGSTIVMLLPQGRCRWLDSLESGMALRMGEAIGKLQRNEAG